MSSITKFVFADFCPKKNHFFLAVLFKSSTSKFRKPTSENGVRNIMTRITSDWEGIVLVTPLGYISRLELSYIFVEGDCYAVLFYPSYD